MEAVVRGTVVYLFLWLVFRIAGKRSIAQITTFDAVLLLIISETVQAALVGTNNSMTNAFILILTLVGIDVLLSVLKQWFPRLDTLMEGTPTVLIQGGELQQEWMNRERVDRADILSAARVQEGISQLGDIDHAVLEKNGGISVIPKRSSPASS
jgi:uncharacterized membrane protein YcaP (DUF421 family)